MTGLGPIGTMVSGAGGRSQPWAAIEEGHSVNLLLAGAAIALATTVGSASAAETFDTLRGVRVTEA